MMSEIDKTTADYIISNEKYFDLALCVEEAMPTVRMRLARMVLEDVEKKFLNDEWEKIPPNYDNITHKHCPLIVLRKKDWYKLASGDRETGIILAEDKGGFTDLYICLKFHSSICSNSEESERIFGEFDELSRECNYKRAKNRDEMNGGMIWEHMRSLSDRRWSENFFKRAMDEKKRKEIVDFLTERINKMAELVNSTMLELILRA